MAAVLLDTTVLIDLLRGRNGAVARLHGLRRSSDLPFVSAVNVEEVFRGLRDSEQQTAAALIAGLSLAPLGKKEGELAGNWRSTYAKHGRTLAQADCLVAAAAVGIGARLATGNPKDFPMQELEVEHWVVGE